MPEKTLVEGALIFHTATARGVETVDETIGSERFELDRRAVA